MKKGIIVAVFRILSVACMLTMCLPMLFAGGAKESTAELSSTGPIELTFWTTKSDLFEKDLQEFMAKNPDITVKATFQGDYDSMVQKVMAGLAAGSIPNVVQLGQRHGIPQIYDSGKLIPIENFMSKEEIVDILPAFWERFTYKGKKVITPFQNSMPIMHYNKNLFDNAGVKIPDTFDELIEASKKLAADTNGDGINDVYGFCTASDKPWYIQPLVWNQNALLVHPNGKVTVNIPELEKVFAGYAKMVHEYKSMPANQHATAEEDFCNGKTAVYFSSCASLNTFYKKIGDRFTVVSKNFPKIDKRYVPIGGNGLGIMKSNKRTEEASWKLVSFFLEKERVAAISLSTGYIPIKKSSMELKSYQEAIVKDPNRKAAYDQLQYLKGQPINPADSLLWSGFDTILEKVESDPNCDIKAELIALQKDIDKYLGDYAKK